MIGSILRVHAINLRRDRAAQILTFVVPVVFFTIFALVFGGSRGATHRVHIAAVDESRTVASGRASVAVTVCCSPKVRSVSSASVPAATVRPRSMMTMRSQRASASSRWWVVRSSAAPSALSSASIS